jgi:RimJ/RimL family protein N-acetyltransferase
MIPTPRLTLRPLERRDLDAFVAYRSDPAVAAFQSWDVPYPLAEAEDLLAEQQGRQLGRSPGWVQLAIADAHSGALLGDCACCMLEHPPRTAELGITLARASQGRGVAREALEALVTALFGEHGVHRVIAHADDRNAPVQRLLSALGMRCEGRFVEADWHKGEWTTLRLYALLAREHQRS